MAMEDKYKQMAPITKDSGKTASHMAKAELSIQMTWLKMVFGRTVILSKNEKYVNNLGLRA